MAANALVLVAMLSAASVSAASKQASWPVALGGNGHTYRVVSQAGLVSWDSAHAAASAAGGYLATITSPAENAFIFSLIDDPAFWNQTANCHGPWIGAYQPSDSTEPGGGWSWVPRSGVTNAELFSYANWETGEPNNFVSGSQNQDRAAFFHLGTGRAAAWSDEYNQTGAGLNQWTISYVIEFSGSPPTLANPQIVSGSDLRFSFTNQPGSYFEVLATTNLMFPITNWMNLGGVPEISSGQFQFTDFGATNYPQRFYRVVSP